MLPGLKSQAGFMAGEVPEITYSGFAITHDTATSSSHSVTLPSYNAGDMILVMLSLTPSSGSVSISGFDAGYTLLFNASNPASSNSYYVYYKIATGAEGGTFSFTTATPYVNTIGIVHVIENCQGAAEASIYYYPGGSLHSPDPPLLTPSWGSAKNIWFVGTVAGYLSSLGPPSGFVGYQETGPGGTPAECCSAYQISEAASLNPGAYSGQVGAYGVDVTIALRPL